MQIELKISKNIIPNGIFSLTAMCRQHGVDGKNLPGNFIDLFQKSYKDAIHHGEEDFEIVYGYKPKGYKKAITEIPSMKKTVKFSTSEIIILNIPSREEVYCLANDAEEKFMTFARNGVKKQPDHFSTPLNIFYKLQPNRSTITRFDSDESLERACFIETIKVKLTYDKLVAFCAERKRELPEYFPHMGHIVRTSEVGYFIPEKSNSRQKSHTTFCVAGKASDMVTSLLGKRPERDTQKWPVLRRPINAKPEGRTPEKFNNATDIVGVSYNVISALYKNLQINFTVSQFRATEAKNKGLIPDENVTFDFKINGERIVGSIPAKEFSWQRSCKTVSFAISHDGLKDYLRNIVPNTLKIDRSQEKKEALEWAGEKREMERSK